MEYIFKSEKSIKNIERLRAFLVSEKWMAVLFVITGAIACLASYLPKAQIEIYGTIFMGYITGVCLLIVRDIMGWLTPALFTYFIAIRCYDSLDTFMGLKIFFIPLIFMLLFHFIVYRKPLNFKGSQLKPMIFVSIAIILGGLGFIDPKEYFGGSSLYHMIGLGFGMVLIYGYFNAHIEVRRDYSLIDKLTKIMVVVGLFGSFMIIMHYAININEVIDKGHTLYLRWRNNLSTILMITMPFTFLMANKKSYASIFGFIFYGAMLLTGSRGGMIFGAIELIMCIVMFVLYDKRRRLAYIIICGCILCGFLIFAPQITEFLTYTVNRIFRALNGVLLGENTETRVAHYARGIEDFLNQPIFGTGLGYMGNRDIFKNKEGSLCFYHCEPIQVAASFGIVGILAFGYQFIKRNILIWKKATLFNMTIFLSYISLEMMSLVNPGILCPMPYLMLITLFMVVVEKCDDGEYQEKIYITKIPKFFEKKNKKGA